MDKEVHVDHPSFGSVVVSRVQASHGIRLFQSPLSHHHVISLAIKEAHLTRQLAQDWVRPERSIVEVMMSMSQFGQMISGIGLGEGTPCTIYRREGREVPPLDGPGVKETFEGEIKEVVAGLSELAESSVKRVHEILEKKTVNKSDMKEALDMIQKMARSIQSTLPFIHTQFERSMDKSVNAAKVEIEHFADDVLRRSGVKAMMEAQGIDQKDIIQLKEGE